MMVKVWRREKETPLKSEKLWSNFYKTTCLKGTLFANLPNIVIKLLFSTCTEKLYYRKKIPWSGTLMLFYISVRGPQYICDITVIAKIPEEVAHKLPFERFRIWPLAFWPYPERCKNLAFFR